MFGKKRFLSSCLRLFPVNKFENCSFSLVVHSSLYSVIGDPLDSDSVQFIKRQFEDLVVITKESGAFGHAAPLVNCKSSDQAPAPFLFKALRRTT